jgi:hypothetical protein
MRKIYLAFIAIIIFSSACDDSFIDRKPLGSLSDGLFFSTKEGIMQGLNGCYDMLGRIETFRRNHQEIANCMSDDAEVGGKDGDYEHPHMQDLHRFISTSDNDYSAGYWKYQYRGVSRCNELLKAIPDVDMDSETKNRVIAEAKFLRALYHFYLNIVYGGVPIVDHVLEQSEYYTINRSSMFEVFDFIAKELESIRDNLPLNYSGSSVGRATRGAANALLAKTYLYIASHKKYSDYVEWHGGKFGSRHSVNADNYWEKAELACEEVMNSSQYALLQGNHTLHQGSYYSFQLHAYGILHTIPGNNSKEKIFEIQHYDGLSGGGNNFNEGNVSKKWFLVRDCKYVQSTGDTIDIPKPGFGFNCPSHDLYEEFEAADSIRRSISIRTNADSILWIYNDSTVWCLADHKQSPTGYSFGKTFATYNNIYGGGGTYPGIQHGANVIIIRYADVLLMHAEACMEQGKDNEAMDDLKLIRNRVGLSDYPDINEVRQRNGSYSDITNDLQVAVYHERRCELAMEDQRWFDLVRWGRAKTELEDASDSLEANEQQGSKTFSFTFVEGKHEYLPIPEAEIKVSEVMKQNSGY